MYSVIKPETMSKSWSGNNKGSETLTSSLFLFTMQQMVEAAKKSREADKRQVI